MHRCSIEHNQDRQGSHVKWNCWSSFCRSFHRKQWNQIIDQVRERERGWGAGCDVYLSNTLLIWGSDDRLLHFTHGSRPGGRPFTETGPQKPGLIFPQWQAGCDWVSSACARQFLAQKSAWDSNFKTLHRNLRRLWTMTIFTWVVNNWQITWHVCLSSFFVLWKKISRIFLWHSEISNHLNSFAITA